jgi:RNA polymerase sigma-70 factor (ECF subfamily)
VDDELRALRDELLAVRCRLGEPAAFDELTRRFGPNLLYYLRRLLPQEADARDALQRTWAAAFRGLRRLDDPRALRAWLYGVARRQAGALARGDRAWRSHVDAAIDPDDLAAADWTPRADEAERVHHALGSLSLPHREALALFFLEAMSIAEIAAVAGVPAGTVKSRLFHAKRALRDALERGEESR